MIVDLSCGTIPVYTAIFLEDFRSRCKFTFRLRSGLKRPVKNALDGFYNHVGAYMHQYVVDSAYVIVV